MKENALLAAALDYIELGLSVVALHSPNPESPHGCTCGGKTCTTPAKHPRWDLDLLPNGSLSATTDPGMVYDWWKKWPAANVGIVLMPSGLVTIGPDNEEWASEFARRGLPPTATFESGGGAGHLHYLYRRTEDCPVHRDCLSQEYDILSNGLVVAPPSRHVSGRTYRWLRSLKDAGELPDCPRWAVEQLIEKAEAEAKSKTKSAASVTTDSQGTAPLVLPPGSIEWWEGRRAHYRKSGAVDRSRTLSAIAFQLAGAGASRPAIAEALAERDESLGYRKYTDRKDKADRYAQMADAAANGAQPMRPVVAQAATNGTDPVRHTSIVDETTGEIAAPPLPQIEVHDRHQRDVTADAIAALASANEPPRLFEQGGIVVREKADEEGAVSLERVTSIALRYELNRAADWTRTRSERSIRIACPKDTAEDLFGRGDWSFLPPLAGIVSAPCFTEGGVLLLEPGYHKASRLLYHRADDGARFQPPPQHPSAADLAAAKALLMNELLVDFPFDSKASLANAVGLLILPAVRDLIPGPTPMHLIDSPTEGTGKGLLAQALARPWRPDGVDVTPAPAAEEEWRKKLTSTLRDTPSHVLFDNLRSKLESGALAAALTAPRWTDRLLGASLNIKLPVRCVWVATGNNIDASSEIRRRSPWIRIDAECERPAERTDFRHPDLLGWLRQNRAQVVGAVLTIVQAWIAAGSPSGDVTFGSFEEWGWLVGGILQVAGIEDFLANREQFHTVADSDTEEWRALVAAWSRKFGDREVSARNLYAVVEALGLLDHVIDEGPARARQTRFGILLKTQRNRVYTLVDAAGKVAHKQIVFSRDVQRLARYRLIDKEPRCRP